MSKVNVTFLFTYKTKCQFLFIIVAKIQLFALWQPLSIVY